MSAAADPFEELSTEKLFQWYEEARTGPPSAWKRAVTQAFESRVRALGSFRQGDLVYSWSKSEESLHRVVMPVFSGETRLHHPKGPRDRRKVAGSPAAEHRQSGRSGNPLGQVIRSYRGFGSGEDADRKE